MLLCKGFCKISTLSTGFAMIFHTKALGFIIHVLLKQAMSKCPLRCIKKNEAQNVKNLGIQKTWEIFPSSTDPSPLPLFCHLGLM